MSALRALRQLTSTSVRARSLTSHRLICTAASPSRAASHLSRAFLTGPSALASAASRRAFSVTPRALGEGASDALLAQRLGEELQYEKEAVAGSQADEPKFLKDFKEQGIWTIEDTLGNEEVTMTRTFGNETIRLMFSILDIQDANDPDYAEEENENEEDAEREEDPEPLNNQPIRVSFTITKANLPSAINVDTTCQEGAFIIDNIAFYKDAKLAADLTAEADWSRRGLYLGPHFDTLDVQVQNEFEAYMQERGIGDSLALFIPEYAEHKELKEYVHWLQNLKSFIEQ